MGPNAFKELAKGLLAAALEALRRGEAEDYRPPFVWGPPGIGKSAIMKQVARELDWGFTDVRAALLDPVDVRGVPFVDKVEKRAYWAAPNFLPTEKEAAARKGWLVFFDELPQAAAITQSALLQLTHAGDRCIGEYKLPINVLLGSAGNRQEDRAGANRLITPLLGRFQHYEMDVSYDDWMDWSLLTGVASEVRSFIKRNPGRLYDFDPKKSDLRAWPNPRSWEAVSFNLRALGYDAKSVQEGAATGPLYNAVAACVGTGDAGQFVADLKYHAMMPDLDALWKDPEKAPIPEQPAIIWALLMSVTERCQRIVKAIEGGDKTYGRDTVKAIQPAITYYARKDMAEEYCCAFFRDIVKLVPNSVITPEFSAKYPQLKDLFRK